MSTSALVVGATSTIAEAVCRRVAAAGGSLVLLGRSEQRLAATAEDLRLRGASAVAIHALDLNDGAALVAALDAAFAGRERGFDWALVAQGTLLDEDACSGQPEATARVLRDNAESVILAGGRIARHLERQRRGTIAFLVSVAADRGRGTNATYGAAKAAVATYASGLSQRLTRSGVRVLAIKLGPVQSAMTAQLQPGLLWIDADDAARRVLRALPRRQGAIYCPWYWRPIMALIRALPGPLFRRLRF